MKVVTVLAVGLIAVTVGFFVYAAQTGQDPRELFEDAKSRAKRFDMDDTMNQIQRRMGRAEDSVQQGIEDVQDSAEATIAEAEKAVDSAVEGAPA